MLPTSTTIKIAGDSVGNSTPTGRNTPGHSKQNMNILQLLKSWFSSQQDSDATDTTSDPEDKPTDSTDDERTRLDPEGVQETRVDTSETLPDELEEDVAGEEPEESP